MSKLTPSALVSELKGKCGDLVFQRNRGGAIVRALPNPVQPDTPKQLINRQIMRDAVSQWQNLPEIERVKWNEFAELTNAKSISADARQLSGYNLFISRALAMLQYIPGLLPYPVVAGVTPSGSVTVDTLTSSQFIITSTCKNLGDYGQVNLFASPEVSPGKMALSSVRFVFIRSLVEPGPVQFSLYTEYLNAFGIGGLTSGKKIFIKAVGFAPLNDTWVDVFKAGAGVIAKSFNWTTAIVS